MQHEEGKLRGYAICTSGRSGSNWICSLLSSTNQLGHPREYFNCEARRQFDDPNYPAKPAEQIRRILTMGATANGIYALKVFPRQHDAVSATSAWTKLLPDLKFVWLQRRDILGQAISGARAIQTRQFRSSLPVTAPATYDAKLIREWLVTVVKAQARWSLFFARTGILPLAIDYEDVVADPQGTIDQIAKMMRLTEPAVIQPELSEFQMQRDTMTEEWRARFLREEGGADTVDQV